MWKLRGRFGEEKHLEAIKIDSRRGDVRKGLKTLIVRNTGLRTDIEELG